MIDRDYIITQFNNRYRNAIGISLIDDYLDDYINGVVTDIADTTMNHTVGIDELNVLEPQRKILDIDTYFNEMELTESEKENRKRTARALFDVMLFLFSLIALGNDKEADDSNWWLSTDRATFLAENESNNVQNYIDYQNAVRKGFKFKTWKSKADGKVRKDHMKLHGTKKKIDELFIVGDSLMRFPKDEMYSPNPKQTINCRCSCKYSSK